MLGKRSDQKGLWEADRLYLDYVGKDTFYGLLASLRGQELGLDGQPGVFPLSDRLAEMGGIPVNDDGGEQVEPGHAVMLALARAGRGFRPGVRSGARS